MSKLVSLLKEKCPNCGRGEVFKDKGNVFLLRLPKMHEKCQVCNYYFDREPGYYWGAMYFSYAFAIAEAIGVYFLCWFLFEDPYDYRTVILILVSMLLLSLFNFRYSRLFWMYMFAPGKK